jgi:uncharacterized protein YceH (UPF0502 family)
VGRTIRLAYHPKSDTLIEKSFITPDAYPLSINAITTGCNQLTAREPVMSLSEAEVQDAVDRLIVRRLVSKRDQQSARVAKYEHLVRLRHSLPPAEQAVLAILLLRGAQTAGELRQRCERLHRFDDVAAVDAVLEHLAEKYPPLVAELPRAPGTKETRHVHLLGGDAAVQEMAEAQSVGTPQARARAHRGTRGRGPPSARGTRRAAQRVRGVPQAVRLKNGPPSSAAPAGAPGGSDAAAVCITRVDRRAAILAAAAAPKSRVRVGLRANAKSSSSPCSFIRNSIRSPSPLARSRCAGTG